MEKKYQFFISSTYEDLKEERAVVTNTILQLEQIPIGMEMFNAGDETQWDLIKRTIDASDYYLVIIGSRYGTTITDENNRTISYTEKEYAYAESIGKPILTFLKEDAPPPTYYPTTPKELDEMYYLAQFKRRAKTKIAAFWTNKDNLSARVSNAIHNIMKQKPGIGWIRADEYEIQKRDLSDWVRRYDELLRSRKADPETTDSENAHWASEEDIKKDPNIIEVALEDPTYRAAGIPIIVPDADKSVYVDNSEAHSLIIGSTGSGKTRRLILPLINLLAKHGESMIITDPKGELYAHTKTMLNESDYKIVTINLRNPQIGNAWNPLWLPYTCYKDGNKDRALEMLYDLAGNIFNTDQIHHKDPFWNNSAADYFCGLAIALFEDGDPHEINLNSILNMDASGNERFGGPNNNYSKEYFNMIGNESLAYINASGTVYAPDDTKGGILSTFRQCIKVYASKIDLSKMLAANDFDIKTLADQKHAVFVIMHDEKRTYHPLVSTFIKQCYDTLLIQAHAQTGRLSTRVNFVLDEFANITPISDMPSMITAARSRNIRFHLVIQGINQLTSQYGSADADVIKGNCGNWVYLVSKELPILRELSELCGTEIVLKSGQFQFEKPLISISRLLTMSLGQALILRDRESPFLTYLPDISSYNNWKKQMAYAKDEPLIDRDAVHIFNLQEYVKKRKKEKLDQMLAASGEK